MNYITPEHVNRVVIEVNAPLRNRRVNQPEHFVVNLFAEFEREAQEENQVREEEQEEDQMDIVSKSSYQEHYTLPEFQLYGYEEDIMPHPNITLFRGNQSLLEEDEDEDEDEMDIIPHPNITLFRGNQSLLEEEEDEMDIIPHPNFTLFRGNRVVSDDEMSSDLDLGEDDQENEDQDDALTQLDIDYDEDAMDIDYEDNTQLLYL